MAETNSSEFSEGSNQQLDKVVQATTNIIYVKIMIFALPLMYGLSWIPKISVVGYWGFLILLIVLPIAAIIWLIKYRSVGTDDIFFKRAKRFPVVALALSGVMLAVLLVGPISYLSFQLSRLAGSPSTMVVIEDVDGQYWALHASRIEKKNRNTIIIKKDTIVAKDPGPGVPYEPDKYSPEDRDRFVQNTYAMHLNNSARYKPGTIYRGFTAEGTAGVTEIRTDTEVEVKRIASTWKSEAFLSPVDK